jgi:hypothetical protein
MDDRRWTVLARGKRSRGVVIIHNPLDETIDGREIRTVTSMPE